MSARLPDSIDPLQLARKGAVLSGNMPLSGMSRLNGLIGSPGSDDLVSVSLEFMLGEYGQCRIVGEWCATVHLPCQRCLRMMPFPVKGEILLAVSRPGREREVPDEFEVIELEGQHLRLMTIVEDEIILGLPIVPMHDLADCQVGSDYQEDILKVASTPDLQRPFAHLADLLEGGARGGD